MTDTYFEKWDKTGMLDGFNNSANNITKKLAANLLENQRRYNENIIDIHNDIHSHGLFGCFKRISVPITRRFLTKTNIPHLINFAVIPIDKISEKHDLSVALRDPKKIRPKSQCAIDAEYDVADEMANTALHEIEKHVINKIIANVGTIGSFNEESGNWSQCLNLVMKEIRNKCGRYPNWIIGSKDFVKEIKETGDYKTFDDDQSYLTSNIGVRRDGLLKYTIDEETIELKVFSNTLFEQTVAVVGVNGNDISSMEMRVRVLLDPHLRKIDSNDMWIDLMSHYHIYMPQDCYKMYGRIVMYKKN